MAGPVAAAVAANSLLAGPVVVEVCRLTLAISRFQSVDVV